MKTKTSLLVATVVLGLGTSAFAQETLRTTSSAPLGFGAGTEAMLPGGPFGAAFVFDMGDMHIDAILGFHSGNGQGFGLRQGMTLNLGGRALWVLHRTGSADFSLGGGLGIIHQNPDNDPDTTTDLHVEALAQIRAFIVQNVALSSTFGFGVRVNDEADDSFAFGGQLLGSLGLVYFFQ